MLWSFFQRSRAINGLNFVSPPRTSEATFNDGCKLRTEQVSRMTGRLGPQRRQGTATAFERGGAQPPVLTVW